MFAPLFTPQIIALYAVIGFTLSAIPLGMICHRVDTGSWRGFWSA